jgi:hypothetical protein
VCFDYEIRHSVVGVKDSTLIFGKEKRKKKTVITAGNDRGTRMENDATVKNGC